MEVKYGHPTLFAGTVLNAGNGSRPCCLISTNKINVFPVWFRYLVLRASCNRDVKIAFAAGNLSSSGVV